MAEVERHTSGDADARQQVLDAAIAIMCQQGYVATTLEAACKRANVRRRSVEADFADRDSLITAVMEEISQGWVTEIQSQVDMVGTPMERRDQLVAGLRHIVVNRPELLRVMYIMLLEHDRVAEDARKMIDRVNTESMEAIAAGFNQTLGMEIPDIDLIAHTIIGVMLYTYRRTVLDPSLDTQRVFEDLKITIDSLIRERLYRLRKAAN